MEEEIETKDSKKIENLIGVLLMIPIYIIFFGGLNLLNFNIPKIYLIPFSLLMYPPMPTLIGIILSYKKYKTKISKSTIIYICIFISFILAFYFYFNTYFAEHSGWDSIGYLFLLLVSICLSRIFSYIFYAKIVGWKKASLFFVIYILIITSSFALNLWA